MMCNPQKERAAPGEVAAQSNALAKGKAQADITPVNAGGQVHIQQWMHSPVVTFMGQRDSHGSEEIPHKLGHDYATITLGEVFQMEPGSQEKGAGPAMIPSSYFGWNARTHDVQRQRGSFVALSGDIDKGNPSLEAVQSAVRDFVGADVASLVYSSSSASTEVKKWRVLIPLENPAGFEQWENLQTVFFTFMEERGLVMDWALARAAQPVYLPNVPPSKRGADGEPLFHERATVVGRGLMATDAVVAALLNDLRQQIQAQESAAAEAREAARIRTRNRQESGATSVIEAFNGARSIEQMLEANGYSRGPRENWRSPYQSSKTFATKNFGDRWVSMSESDAHAGLGLLTSKGFRSGDAFDLFCHFEHAGDQTKAVKAAAQLLGMDRSGKDRKMARAAVGDSEASKLAQELRRQAGQGLPSAQEPQAASVPSGSADLAGFRILAMPDGIKVTEFVVDGFLPNGVTVISGEPGAGKSTNLVALAASVAHLAPQDWGFRPKRRRTVVWLSEHTEQVFDAIEATLRETGAAPRQEWEQQLKVVPTKRSTPEELASLIAEVNIRFSWQNERGAVVHPLIVWDTAAATIDVTDENDNSTISKAIALAKQALEGGALWVIHHTPKASKGSTDVKTMSARGGSAFEGDANCTAYLFTSDDGRRVLGLGKVRFSPEFSEIHFSTARHTETIVDEFDGQELEKTVTAGIPSKGSREGRQQEKKDSYKQGQMDAILQAATEAANKGKVCSGNQLIRLVRESSGMSIGNDQRKELFDRMKGNGMLRAVDIPDEVRRQLKLKGERVPVLLPANVDPETVFRMAMQPSIVPDSSRSSESALVKTKGMAQ